MVCFFRSGLQVLRYHKHLLQSAVDALNGIFSENRYADKCIEYYLRNNKKWGGRDRRFFAETVYDCVRWWRLYLFLNDHSESKPVDLAFLGASFWNRKMPMPDFPEFSPKVWESYQAKNESISDASVKESFPHWLFSHLSKEVKGWEQMAPYFNQTNKLVLRVNQSHATCEQVIKALSEENIIAEKLIGTESGLIIKERVNIFRSPVFKKGWVEVQDGSSQNVAPFMDLEPGMRVVDACAGAGGKTLHIADILRNKGKIISLDIHDWKLTQLKLRARRDSFSNIEMKCIDSSKVIKRMAGTADRLLLDVPCTGLGVLRRNPDTKWKLSESRLKELEEIQADILKRYSQMLKAGGKMLYATCSVLPSENEKQVERFLGEHENFSLEKQKWYYPTRPGFDGFYMALLEKNS